MASWRTPPAPIPEEQISHVHEADIIVVGLAHAGSAAVRAAAEAGAKVIGIEEKKEKLFSVWGADYGHINSKFLESRGVPKADPIEYYNEMMRRSGGRANPGLVMRFCQNAGTAFDWYTDMVEDFSSVSIAFWPGGKKFDGEMAGYKFWPGTAKFPQPGGFGPPPGGKGGPGGPGAPGGPGDGPGGPPDEKPDFPGGIPVEGENNMGDRFLTVESQKEDVAEQVKKKPSLLGLAKANQQKAVELGKRVAPLVGVGRPIGQHKANVVQQPIVDERDYITGTYDNGVGDWNDSYELDIFNFEYIDWISQTTGEVMRFKRIFELPEIE